jgi:endonuclease/exonuclease/phosphatase family metal-dependent hydrolase
MNVILQRMSQNRNVEIKFLTGDLNAYPHEEPIKNCRKVMEDASFEAKVKKNANCATFHAFFPSDTSGEKIDYIFFSCTKKAPCTAEEFEIVRDYDGEQILASDHRPIDALFRY